MAWTAPKTNWSSVDGVDELELNKIGANLVYLKAHVDATTGIHGAVSAATASKLVIRDASGRAQFVAPSAAADVAILSTVTAHTDLVDNPHGVTKIQVGLENVENVEQVAVGGDTMEGPLVGNFPNTDYTTAMLRNIKLQDTVPGVDDLENGEIAFVYE
jgi:RNase P/RNase MRP subunit p29